MSQSAGSLVFHPVSMRASTPSSEKRENPAAAAAMGELHATACIGCAAVGARRAQPPRPAPPVAYPSDAFSQCWQAADLSHGRGSCSAAATMPCRPHGLVRASAVARPTAVPRTRQSAPDKCEPVELTAH
jgi:hypothetical protein